MEALALGVVPQLSKAAWQISWTLYKFCGDTKNINKTVEDLNREVKALACVCDTIHDELNEIISETASKSSFYDKAERLWLRITEQTKECEATLGELAAIISDIQAEGSNRFAQGRRQIQLNLRKDDLDRIRCRIQTHVESLQTILLVVNIKVSHLAPRLANEELSMKVGELQLCIQRLQDQLQTAPQDRPLEHSATLIDYAKDVMLSGVTLYEASVAGGSVTGGAHAASANTRVAAWLSSFESLRRDAMPSEASDDLESRTFSVFSGEEARTVPTDPTSIYPDPRGHQENEDFDNDSDADLAIEIVEAALLDGAKAFDQEEWLEAELLYEEALQNLQTLPAQSRPECDTFELQFRLAICAFHTKDSDEAEDALTGLMQQSATSLTEVQTRYICDAGHMLSLLHVRMGKFEAAKACCERTLKTKARLFDKTHDSRLETLALMSRIYQLLGNNTRAKIFIGMIPEGRRDSFRAAVQDQGAVDPVSPTYTIDDNMSMSTLALVDFEPVGDTSNESRLEPPVRSRTLSTDVPRLASSASSPQTRSRAAHIRTMSAAEDSRSNPTPIALAPGARSGARTTSETVLAHMSASSDVSCEGHIAVADPLSGLKAMESLVGAPKRTATPNSPPTKDVRHHWLAQLHLTAQSELDRLICDGHVHEATTLLKTLRRSSLAAMTGQITALHFAALFGDVELAETMLAGGADPFAQASVFNPSAKTPQDDTDLHPVSFAVGGRHPRMVKLLVAAMRRHREQPVKGFGATLLDPRWLRATDCQDPDEIVAVLRVIDELGLLEPRGWSYTGLAGQPDSCNSLLHLACRIPADRSQLRVPVVSFLMAAKMNVTTTTALIEGKPQGYLPLHYAIESDDADVVQMLLQRQCELQLNAGVDRSGDSLHLAISRAILDPKVPLDTVERLLEAGANVENETSTSSWKTASSPSRIVEKSGRDDLKQLLRKKARVHCFHQSKEIRFNKKANMWVNTALVIHHT